MSRKPEPVPHFSTEAEERAYWEHNDSANHVEWTKAAKVRLPHLNLAAPAKLAIGPDQGCRRQA